MDLSTPKLRTTVTEAAALINSCATDLRTTRETIDRHKASARLSVAEVSNLERTIRDGIEHLWANHSYRASAQALGVLLTTLNVPWDVDGDELVVKFETPEELLNLGAYLAQHCPRAAASLIGRAMFNKERTAVRWKLDAERRAA